jgi:cation transporter-like permease
MSTLPHPNFYKPFVGQSFKSFEKVIKLVSSLLALVPTVAASPG